MRAQTRFPTNRQMHRKLRVARDCLQRVAQRLDAFGWHVGRRQHRAIHGLRGNQQFELARRISTRNPTLHSKPSGAIRFAIAPYALRLAPWQARHQRDQLGPSHPRSLEL
jgi:hypothetical protein